MFFFFFFFFFLKQLKYFRCVPLDQDQTGRWRGKHATHTLNTCYLASAEGYVKVQKFIKSQNAYLNVNMHGGLLWYVIFQITFFLVIICISLERAKFLHSNDTLLAR